MTLLRAGGNCGWDPRDRPGLDCPDNYCGYAGTNETMPMTDTKRFPDALEPTWVYNREGGRGMGPAQFLNGTAWGKWQGDLLVGVMGAQELWRLDISPKNVTVNETMIQGACCVAHVSLAPCAQCGAWSHSRVVVCLLRYASLPFVQADLCAACLIVWLSAGDDDGNPFEPVRFRGLRLGPEDELYVVENADSGDGIYQVTASVPAESQPAQF